MTDQTQANRRDQVLIAFHRDCTCPTVDQIIEWTTRYPEFAEDIREHAAILRDWAAELCDEEEPADDLLLQRGRSFALNAIPCTALPSTSWTMGARTRPKPPLASSSPSALRSSLALTLSEARPPSWPCLLSSTWAGEPCSPVSKWSAN